MPKYHYQPLSWMVCACNGGSAPCANAACPRRMTPYAGDFLSRSNAE